MEKGVAIVVAHNSGSYVKDCLAAIPSEWEILLIDNGSEPGTAYRGESQERSVKYIRNQENLGFAGAINQGVALTTAPVVVALNPDAVTASNSLDKLAKTLAKPGVGAAGGLLLGGDGRPQKGFVVRCLPTLASSLSEVLLLNRLWPSNPWNSRYRCLNFDYSVAQEIEQPAGAALAFRREAWGSIGGFDEQFYPVWFEDVDFCRRLRERGWKIQFCPQALFRHAGAHSVSRLPFGQRQLYWYGNLLLYFRKHHSAWAVRALRVGVVVGMLLRSLGVIAGGFEGVSRAEALRSYAQVLWRFGVRSLQQNWRASSASPGIPQAAAK
ncbi:MAG: glycosyltransferase family 2 protein [Chlamydiota bacterium]